MDELKKNKVLRTVQSRKFWTTIIVSGMAVTLFLAGQIEIEKMVDIIKWTGGFYVGGLSIEDAAGQLLPIIKAMLAKKS